ncbi:MAG TPA: glutathione S-transferase family protein [Albitalea sp.]|uniref:glutathione S-transferase family protein n=1 Tax=Piscinibacter sp. TaxID=1903157 RepID=UPI002ED5DAFB
MSEIELVSHPLCPYVQRAAIALAEKGVAYRRTDIDLADKPAWFVAISPLGKVPLLRTRGTVIFESAVIVEYLEDTEAPALHPADALERARHRSWMEFGSGLLGDIWNFYVAPDAAAMQAQADVLRRKFERLESALGPGPYFAGERFGLVDAVFAPVFRYWDSFDRIADFGLFRELPRVTAWRHALAQRPSVRSAVAADYGERLWRFLRERGSHLSTLMQ